MTNTFWTELDDELLFDIEHDTCDAEYSWHNGTYIWSIMSDGTIRIKDA